MTMTISNLLKPYLGSKSFAVLTTLFPDGRPHSHMMWFDLSDEHLRINTETGRVKYQHLQRDPRCSLVVFEPDKPYRFVEIQGTAIEFITGATARAHIDSLAHRYRGSDYSRPIATERVIVQIRADRYAERGPTG
jgi:PPOX class probable F420-dependent enzyme